MLNSNWEYFWLPQRSPAPKQNSAPSSSSTPQLSPIPMPQISHSIYDTRNDLEINKIKQEIDLPIAIRKGSCSYTRHSISKFVGYSHLSKQMQAFITNLSATNIPSNFEEAYKEHAIFEERRA